MSEPFKESGLFASLRRLLATSLEVAQVRLELLGTELELEKRRIVDQLLRAAIALMALGVGTVLLCGFVLMLFWDNNRLAASGLLSALFLAVGAVLMYLARQSPEQSQHAFAASLTEIKRDRSELQPFTPDAKR